MLSIGLVLVVLGVLVAAAWSTGRLNAVVCGGDCGPEAVADPAGLERADGLAARDPRAPVRASVDAAAVEDALSGPLEADALGDRVGVSVVDPATGEEVFSSGPETLVPASTTKVLTAAAGLVALDPQQRFETSVARDGDALVLVGGGDPYLVASRDDSGYAQRADLTTLAERTAAALQEAASQGDGPEEVSLGYDTTLFTGPGDNPDWENGYVSGQIVTPIAPLWTNRGISRGVRSSEPARAAAETFARLLRRQGVDVTGDVEDAQAPDTEPIATVQGATVEQAVEALTLSSNNEAAEVLARHVAISQGQEADFAGGGTAVAEVLQEAGVPTAGLELEDGSGLSRGNRIAPVTLAQTVALGISEQAWPDLLAALPVGGFSGSLEDRMDGDASSGAGLVRAKTGTLTGVHSLAGYVTDARGVPLAVALMVDDTEEISALETRDALDAAAAALASCACG